MKFRGKCSWASSNPLWELNCNLLGKLNESKYVGILRKTRKAPFSVLKPLVWKKTPEKRSLNYNYPQKGAEEFRVIPEILNMSL
jgi:hypothetical protein